MAARVKFELVSPEKILVSEDVDMVVVPGTEGYFGVLPGHSPFISSIRPGTIDVYEGKTLGEGKKSIAIAVRVQPKDKTLTEAEIDAIAEKLVAAVAKATGATLRS